MSPTADGAPASLAGPHEPPRRAPLPAPVRFGVPLVAAAALALSAKGIGVKLLHGEGVAVLTMLFLRSLIAAPLFLGAALWRGGPRQLFAVPARGIAAAAGAGFFCFYLGGMADFASIGMIDVGLQRLLVFGYPLFVVVIDAVRRRRLPPLRQWIALAVTFAGMFLVLGGLDRVAFEANLLGAVLAIACAITVATYFIVAQTYAPIVGSVRFNIYAQCGALAAMAIHAGVAFEPSAYALSLRAWAIIVVMAVVTMALAQLALSEGIRRIGAPRAALLATIGPPATLLMAYFALGETMAPIQLVGGAVILLGVLALEGRLPGLRPG